MGVSPLDRDHYQGNALDRIEELEVRIAALERIAAMKFVDAVLQVVGGIAHDLVTEDYTLVDAGSAAATEQAWLEVTVGGVTGYIRVFAAV